MCVFFFSDEKTNNDYSVKKRTTHFGSFYLRVGAISFGIGTMVYSGLEFGQYFDRKLIVFWNDMKHYNVRAKMKFVYSRQFPLYDHNDDSNSRCTNASVNHPSSFYIFEHNWPRHGTSQGNFTIWLNAYGSHESLWMALRTGWRDKTRNSSLSTDLGKIG